MSAPHDRADDPARKFNAISNNANLDAQEHFSAHGSNKGKASDIAANVMNNAEQSYAATGGAVRHSRSKSKSRISARERS